MRIAIDAMGGDHAPKAVIDGALMALSQVDATIVLYGERSMIEKELVSRQFDHSRIEIVHCTEVIESDDSPVKAIKSKKDASMVRGFDDLKSGAVDAFISAGNTGALLAGGTLKIGRVKGIKRPALTTAYPTDRGVAILVDAGANTECDPINLQQFAFMGYLYAKEVMGIQNPVTGLVNIGTEDEKGSTLYKESFKLLTATEGINFMGNLEARDIPTGLADVIVCDGFTGNVVLKLSEGVAKSFGKVIKEAIMDTPLTKVAGLILKKNLDVFKKKMDYAEYGGAPLLGLKRPIVKAHGSSNAKAFMNAIRYADRYASHDIIAKMEDFLA
jgi:glycerol-3-phosphate acyltransferase PlsX